MSYEQIRYAIRVGVRVKDEWTLMHHQYIAKLTEAGLNQFEIDRLVPVAKRTVRRPWYLELAAWLGTTIIIALLGTALYWCCYRYFGSDHIITLISIFPAMGFPVVLPPFLLWRNRRRDIINTTIRLAEDSASRLCANCGYEVRDVDSAIECCPECGSYVSRRPRSDKPPSVSRLDDPEGWLIDGVLFLPIELELTPGDIERMVMETRPPSKPKRWYRNQTLLSIVGTVAILSGFGLLLRLMSIMFNGPWNWILTLGIGFVLCVIGSSLIVNRIAFSRGSTLAARITPNLLAAGCRECSECGGILGPREEQCRCCLELSGRGHGQ